MWPPERVRDRLARPCERHVSAGRRLEQQRGPEEGALPLPLIALALGAREEELAV